MCLPITDEWTTFEAELAIHQIFREFMPLEIKLLKQLYGVNIAPEVFASNLMAWRHKELQVRQKAYEVLNMRINGDLVAQHFENFVKAERLPNS
jgi:hypothetical protein